ADIAASDLGVLGGLLYPLNHLLALLAAHGRHLEADHLAIVVRRHAEGAGTDGLLDVLEDALIIRPNAHLLRIRGANLSELFQGRRRSVIFDAQTINQGGSGPASA